MTKQPTRRRGQRPGTLHLDRRAARLFEELQAHGPDDRLLSTELTAVLLEVSPEWLEQQRHKKRPPNYVKINDRMVRYQLGALRKFIKQRMVEFSGAGDD